MTELKVKIFRVGYFAGYRYQETTVHTPTLPLVEYARDYISFHEGPFTELNGWERTALYLKDTDKHAYAMWKLPGTDKEASIDFVVVD